MFQIVSDFAFSWVNAFVLKYSIVILLENIASIFILVVKKRKEGPCNIRVCLDIWRDEGDIWQEKTKEKVTSKIEDNRSSLLRRCFSVICFIDQEMKNIRLTGYFLLQEADLPHNLLNPINWQL